MELIPKKDLMKPNHIVFIWPVAIGAATATAALVNTKVIIPTSIAVDLQFTTTAKKFYVSRITTINTIDQYARKILHYYYASLCKR